MVQATPMTWPRLMLIALVAAPALAGVAPLAWAAEDADYRACMELARRDGRAGLEAALSMGGSVPALHCRAVALLEMGRAEEAASLLERLAYTRPQPPALQAELLAQAGHAWLSAGAAASARAALSAAIGINPNDPELFIDRGQALIEMGDDWAAVDDFDRALELDPRRLDALLLRAGAYYRLDALDLAMEDANRAVALAPVNIDARIERSAIREKKADRAGAREDLLTVLRLAPDSPAAIIARAALERLDVRQPTAAPRR